ncbi:MAG: Smr/MutS family protein [Gammaproteobacteria bacterium]|nr:Smr/MutS family protein [Gammaproteobacteria bacterium]
MGSTQPVENMTIASSTVLGRSPLNFSRPGIQNKLIRKLRQGKIFPQAECDLHGFTVVQAQEIIPQFIAQSSHNNLRCIRIIHGKGLSSQTPDAPILKNYINQQLREYHLVLAFCSALPQDGGTGAVYVLLKNNGE